jgi:hypothetical protein
MQGADSIFVLVFRLGALEGAKRDMLSWRSNLSAGPTGNNQARS